MEFEKRNYLAIIAVIFFVVVIVAGSWFFFRSDESNQSQITSDNEAFQTVPRLTAGMPRNLIQGYVSEMNLAAGEITVMLAMDIMFVHVTDPRIERTVKLTPDTKYAIMDIATKEETVGTINDLKVWDSVTIGIAESALEVYDRDFFTAKEVVIIVGEI